LRDADPSANPGMFGGFGRSGFGGASGPANTQPLNLEPGDFDTFERILQETQAAYSREDLSALKRLATPEMVSYFADDLTANASRGVVNQISNVKLLQGDLSEAWREGDTDYATVAMRFALVDKMVDRTSGRIVEGSDQPQEATELWTFRRNAGGAWLLSAIQQT
jgi:predicted lipid-binding transport protein (Tim44 family)